MQEKTDELYQKYLHKRLDEIFDVSEIETKKKEKSYTIVSRNKNEYRKEYNFIDENGRLLSEQWFDHVGEFHEGYAKVYFNEFSWCKFIDTNGNLSRVFSMLMILKTVLQLLTLVDFLLGTMYAELTVDWFSIKNSAMTIVK